jgi:hypothetical protein
MYKGRTDYLSPDSRNRGMRAECVKPVRFVQPVRVSFQYPKYVLTLSSSLKRNASEPYGDELYEKCLLKVTSNCSIDFIRRQINNIRNLITFHCMYLNSLVSLSLFCACALYVYDYCRTDIRIDTLKGK